MADWSTVMARPELTLEEKRASWADQCARRGKVPFGDEFGKSHAPTTPSTEGQGA